ncbi:hypothetical protein LEP1GSC036_0535 [Leptospira weilii str. 2006001853]|uniref:Uncharacterized protein n=1 Tax=Leptospira weilii str. 2006001853 TaxID=1001589 RepID=A0A828Z672_9LEPT|nr:hypothetical protein LEP1GSC036_0535 [Leptospira weilii str. 2006001853]EMN43338.1 hypothetical protein LEP1GSC086_1003 [Leptospira weilii str. LNT 1234]QDK22165.1 hypothetical protein FHG67_05025 [Leptospira weilii]QDK26110.1 hypothetical protein FHG68_04940 [Leptospira weilii]
MLENKNFFILRNLLRLSKISFSKLSRNDIPKRILLIWGIPLVLFFPGALFSWGTHYLIMDRALEHFSMKFASGEVESESLDSFVRKEKVPLKVLFDEFAIWEESRGSKRFKKVEFHPEFASVLEFVKTARRLDSWKWKEFSPVRNP